MANAVRTLSIICPAFEEEEVLPQFHRELAVVLDRIAGRYETEVIYVDDGSADDTLQVLKGLARADRRVRYLSFSRNFGKEAALTAGLERARGEAVILMDSDLQHPPGLIPVLLEKWQAGAEVVVSIRRDDPQIGVFKKLTSRLFYRVMHWLSETEIPFAGTDYRLMSRRVVDSLLRMRESHRFLRGMVQWLSFPAVEVPFQADSRKAGTTKYTVRRLLALAGDAVISFSRVPLRLSGFLGGAAVLFSILYGAYAGLRWLLAPEGFSAGWAALLCSVYLVGGSVLCALGLVGEYVGRIYEQVKGRPIYVLKDASPEEQQARPPAELGEAA
jgi:dolichol-phosphate mannosyltransferase